MLSQKPLRHLNPDIFSPSGISAALQERPISPTPQDTLPPWFACWRETCEIRAGAIKWLIEALKSEFEALKSELEAQETNQKALKSESRPFLKRISPRFLDERSRANKQTNQYRIVNRKKGAVFGLVHSPSNIRCCASEASMLSRLRSHGPTPGLAPAPAERQVGSGVHATKTTRRGELVSPIASRSSTTAPLPRTRCRAFGGGP